MNEENDGATIRAFHKFCIQILQETRSSMQKRTKAKKAEACWPCWASARRIEQII
jgi:hypothetical protein